MQKAEQRLAEACLSVNCKNGLQQSLQFLVSVEHLLSEYAIESFEKMTSGEDLPIDDALIQLLRDNLLNNSLALASG